MRTALSVVLTCWPPAPRRAIGVDAHVLLVDVDVDGVVDRRIDRHRGEARMPARVGIEGRDAHEPVHARLGLQPAIGVGALDQQRRRFDAGLFAVMLADDLDLVVVPLGPAHIHALEHLRPILALGAAGAGMDLDIGVVGVGLAGEQRLDLALMRLGPELLQRRLGFGDDARIALLLAERNELDIVVELANETRRSRRARRRAAAARA